MALSWVVTDFETASGVDLKKVGQWRYAEDITTEVLFATYSIQGAEPAVWWPQDGPGSELGRLASDPSVTFIAHSAGFEKAIWRHQMMPIHGFPDIPNSRWHDTQAVAAMKQCPQDLDLLSRVLGLKHQKDMEGAAAMRQVMRPGKDGYFNRTPTLMQRVAEYGLQDTRTEVDAHLALGWLPPGERRVWLLNQRINERGLQLDLDFVRAAQQIVDQASPPLLREFADLTGGLQPGQIQKIQSWLQQQNVFLPNLQKETVAELIGNDPDAEELDDTGDVSGLPSYSAIEAGSKLPEPVRRALSIRQLVGSASVKKLAKMQDCVCSDGRARGLLQYHGTGPGRSAGRLLQPQNFPRPTLKDAEGSPLDVDTLVAAIMTGDAGYVSILLGPPVEAVVSSLRHSVIAGKGRVLMSRDYSGIQARLVLSVAGQHDKTALMAAGKDIYCDMAAQIYKRPIDKKKDPAERQTGKNSVLGLGFQMGAPKFRFKYAKHDPLEFCELVVWTYRKKWAPKVPYLWYGLQDAAVAAVWTGKAHEAYGVVYQVEDKWLTARLPSGRKMWYFDPQKTRRAMPWDKDDIRPGFSYKALKQGVWTTIDAFGGQLTENVIMGMERDIMTEAQLKCEANGLPVCLEVHDEIVVEPLIADADEKAFEQIMLDVPAWVKHIQTPIATEGWIGDRYRK